MALIRRQSEGRGRNRSIPACLNGANLRFQRFSPGHRNSPSHRNRVDLAEFGTFRPRNLRLQRFLRFPYPCAHTRLGHRTRDVAARRGEIASGTSGHHCLRIAETFWRSGWTANSTSAPPFQTNRRRRRLRNRLALLQSQATPCIACVVVAEVVATVTWRASALDLRARARV